MQKPPPGKNRKKSVLTGKPQNKKNVQKPPPEKFPRSNGKMKWETTKKLEKTGFNWKIGKMGNGKNGKV